jgi:hypothetical protein
VVCNYICIWCDSLDYIYICFPTACSSVGTVVAFLGGKAAGTEVNHSLPSSAEVNNKWNWTSTLYAFSWRKQTFYLNLYLYLCLVSERTHCPFEATHICIFIFFWPCILMQFWVMTNLMHSFLMYLFMPLHVSSSKCSSSGGPNCMNTVLDRHVRQSLTRVCYTGWCIDTILPSWWWALAARNM